MSVLKLRLYQVDLLDRTRARMRAGVRRLLLQAPTGAGKTAMCVDMLGGAAAKGNRGWFIVPKRELVRQSSEAFERAGIEHGIIAAGYIANRRPLIQVASIDTLRRRLDRYEPPPVIVLDECHHAAAKTWADMMASIPRAYWLGLSATPERLDGKGLRPYFDELLCGPQVADLIEQGFLAPYRLFAPPSQISTAHVHTVAGDYNRSELAAVADDPAITGDAIAHYLRICPDARAIVFCVSIEHSKHVAAQFTAAGVEALHVDGETDIVVRDGAMDAFKAGRVRVLCNVGLFGEGVDVPSLDAVFDLCPSQSLAAVMQRWGRVLRPAPGKREALIFDHAGNSARHGIPCMEREWSLDGKAARKKAAATEMPVRQCPKCYAVLPAARQSCPCGHVFAAAPREVEQRDGELAEVDKDAAKQAAKFDRLREQAQAETLDDLIALGRARGYRNPEGWAAHMFTARKIKQQQRGAQR